MLNTKKTPAPATLGKGVSAGANERTWSQTTSTFAEMEDFAAVNFLGLTPGEDSGRITPELQNSHKKARRSLDAGIFYCVYAPEKHSESTAIFGREWANKTPFGGICPPFLCGFELPAFFAFFEQVTTCRTSKITRGYVMPELTNSSRPVSTTYAPENLNLPALTLTGKELLRLDTLTDEALGRVFLLQNWCVSSGTLDGVPASERRAVQDVFEHAWQAIAKVRDMLKLKEEDFHA